MARFDFTSGAFPSDTATLRKRVRAFVADAVPADRLTIDPLFFADPEVSRLIGQQGWIGMTWPGAYGGHDRSALERYVVLEELLAAGVPMGAHLTADRQSGPLILRYGTEEQKQTFLPGMARGECYFCIGLSEPDAGSDLAAVRTRATKVDGGWSVTGTKVWTSNAHLFPYMIALVRTEERGEDGRKGLSQFIVDLKAPGISIRPILNMAGSAHFNEVVLTDHFVPDGRVVGQLGTAWSQMIAELALERSGPERFLSSFRLLMAAADVIGADPDPAQAATLGRLFAHGNTIRRMSIAVNAALSTGHVPELEAAYVKDLGTNWEQDIADVCQDLIDIEPDPQSQDDYQRLLALTLLHAPSFSLRGGTREIVRAVIARGLGLR